MILNKENIEQLESRYRTSFINSLAGFRQAVCVGTKSKEGVSNLAIFNSLIHLGADPALYGLISRPHTVQRDTLQNILDTSVYTLNYLHYLEYEKAHQTSARYAGHVSEFDQVGLKEIYHPSFDAPFVESALVKIAMNLEDTLPIPQNNTLLIVGRIAHIELEDKWVGNDGFVRLSEAGVLICQGLDAYFVSESVGRLPYAKP